MQARRYEGLKSFPVRPPLRPVCPMSGQKPHAKALVLFLPPLQFLELFCAHATMFFLPEVLGLFSHIDLSVCVNPNHTFPIKIST